MQHVLPVFIGEAQNNMSTYLDPTVFGFFDGIFKALDIMTPVNKCQGRIASRLQAVFKPDQVIPA
jgi:hypothetical protein